MENRHVVVQAEAGELPSAYGAPPDLSHGRISTLTKSYVLSPFSFELEAGYEESIFRQGLPAQLFRQEIEMGLPARFTVGVQNQIEHFAGDTRDRSFTLEARYALANWNKLPLNPAISAEYRFGLSNGLADSGELALLISHDFPHLIEWAANIFVDREFGGKESTSAGFTQSIEVPVLLPKLKIPLDGSAEGYAVDNQRGLFYTNVEETGKTVAIAKAQQKAWRLARQWRGAQQRMCASICRRFLDAVIKHLLCKCSQFFPSLSADLRQVM